jgi:hypothetical protein
MTDVYTLSPLSAPPYLAVALAPFSHIDPCGVSHLGGPRKHDVVIPIYVPESTLGSRVKALRMGE